MLAKRIDALIEQTTYLLEKQQELKEGFQGAFDSVINAVLEKEENIDPKDAENLKAVKSILQKQKERTEDEFAQDVEFLQEQIEAIKNIQQIEDEKKAEEFLDMIISPEEELEDTEEFKKQINAEGLSAINELKMMQEDIKNSLKEGNLTELKLMLEALGDEAQEEDAGDEQDGCSSSCKDCSLESKCDGGTDIFGAFSELEKKDQD